MVNKQYLDTVAREIFKPGAVLVSYGMRGGGKTHCAVSFCQRLIEGWFDGSPAHVELITNVIFVRRTEEGFETRAPPGVHMVHHMREIFPIIVDILRTHGRKDTLIILLLDEAQNFLLGDDNNRGDMASSMKKFCGIIRKFNLLLWLLSPAMRNLGPAFRNFLDADNDPGNVNATFQKNSNAAKRYLASRGLRMDPRSLVWVQTGATEKRKILPVPTSSWTRDPESIAVGDYVYDNLSSADFDITGFPFREFVQAISGRSSYELIEAVDDFYASHPDDDAEAEDPAVAEAAVKRRDMEILAACLRIGLPTSTIAEVLGKHPNTILNWKKRLKAPERASRMAIFILAHRWNPGYSLWQDMIM